MNSPKYNKIPKAHNKTLTENIGKNQQQPSQSFQIKPWNSNRIAKITACLTNNNNSNNIFTISNRNSLMKNTKQQLPQFSKSVTHKLKPKTAPQKSSAYRHTYHNLHNKNNLSQQLAKLGPVATEQVLDDDFQQNLESINFYPQFRASVQPKRNLLYLKPYLNGNYKNRKQYNMSTFDGMQKLKTQLYKGINQSQQIYAQNQQKQNQNPVNQQQNQLTLNLNPNPNPTMNLNTNRSVIQYMTEYEGDEQNKKIDEQSRKRQYSWSRKQKQIPLTVLRQKLKNRYKQSNYSQKIIRVKRGQAIPITILQ